MNKTISRIAAALSIAAIFAFFNPSEQDFLAYSLDKYGNPPSSQPPQEIEIANLLLFSIYTPVRAQEHGSSHVGVLGQFIEISSDQFHAPVWLDFFLNLR